MMRCRSVLGRAGPYAVITIDERDVLDRRIKTHFPWPCRIGTDVERPRVRTDVVHLLFRIEDGNTLHDVELRISNRGRSLFMIAAFCGQQDRTGRRLPRLRGPVDAGHVHARSDEEDGLGRGIVRSEWRLRPLGPTLRRWPSGLPKCSRPCHSRRRRTRECRRPPWFWPLIRHPSSAGCLLRCQVNDKASGSTTESCPQLGRTAASMNQDSAELLLKRITMLYSNLRTRSLPQTPACSSHRRTVASCDQGPFER